MGFEIKAMLIDGNNPDRVKQIRKVTVQGASSEDVTIEIKDPNETRTFSEDISLPVSTVGVVSVYPDYAFREAEVTIKTADKAVDLTATLKRVMLEIETW
jgi:hypothetical protein